MILFPHCKINLGLRILRKRADGYHDLATLFYPITALKDALELIPGDKLSLHVTGADIPGDSSSNLCIKAYELLARDFPGVRPVQIFLHKSIPMGAGLGGGSSNGAFTLRALNTLFGLGLDRNELLPYAAALGSDCPFFLYDGPCIASGRGELLTPVELCLSAYQLVLVNPCVHVDTGWAFAQLDRGRGESTGVGQPMGDPGAGLHPAGDNSSDKAPGLPPIEQWKDILLNDFETPVFKAYPQVQDIKNIFYEKGAVYAAMTGSGSTVFGLFPKKERPSFSFPEDYWVSIL